MMLDFGRHTIFILASYGLSVVVLGGLVLHTLHRNRRD